MGEEICTVARRIVEVCQRHGAEVSFLAIQYSMRSSSCATTLIGTTEQEHLDSARAAAEEPIDEKMLADVMAAVGPKRGRHWMSGLPQNNCALHASLPSQAPSFVLPGPAAAVAGDAGEWIQHHHHRPLSSKNRFRSWADPTTPKNSGKKRTPLGRPTVSECY